MNIVIFWEQESWGGVDTHLLELLKTWPDSSDRFVLLYNKTSEGYKRIEGHLRTIPNLRSIPISTYSPSDLATRAKATFAPFLLRTLLYFLKPVLFPLTVLQIRKALRKLGDFDVLLADNGGYPGAWGALAALPAAKSAGIPLRALLVHHSSSYPGIFMGWFEYLVDKVVDRNTNLVICVSYATRESLLIRRNLNEDKLRLRVVHNSLSTPGIPTSIPAKEYKQLLELKQPGEYLVGMLGRVESYKGQEDLVFALSRLPLGEQRRFRLLIIGRGEDKEVERLKKIVDRLDLKERVHFLGYIDCDSMQLISQLDILAMLTRSFEGFGLTVAEAMYVGVPVLVTRVGAVPEFVDDTTGYIVNPTSPVEVMQSLRDYLSDPDKWRIRASIAKEKVSHTGPGMAIEYHQIFNECLSGDR